MGVFSFGFNVRECKLLCIQAINRIKIYRNKKIAEESNCSKTVGDYLSQGKLEMGLMRVEQVIQVQNTLKALEILEVFLEMARTRTEYLAKQKQIPEEMRTSLMSIAYAANRMPDIPELASIRKQFEGRFGREAFADIGMEDPASAGVQAKLVKFLTVDPPRPTEKVDIALKIVEQRQLECTQAELNEVLGIAFDPRPDNTTTSQSGPNIPFIEAPHHAPPIRDPAPVHEYGIPSPVPGPGDFIPPVHHPVPTASHAHSAFAGVPSTAPETSAQLPQAAAAQDPAAVAAVAAPGYLKAINAAMSGATTGDHPILDAGNPGPETYMGTQVRGSVGSANSIPVVPPAAAQVQTSDLLFPDVKWMDAPPPPPPGAAPAGAGVASLSDLPPAPSHDPSMPSAPRFSHTGAVFDPEKGDEGSVHDDLVERLNRLKQ